MFSQSLVCFRTRVEVPHVSGLDWRRCWASAFAIDPLLRLICCGSGRRIETETEHYCQAGRDLFELNFIGNPIFIALLEINLVPTSRSKEETFEVFRRLLELNEAHEHEDCKTTVMRAT